MVWEIKDAVEQLLADVNVSAKIKSELMRKSAKLNTLSFGAKLLIAEHAALNSHEGGAHSYIDAVWNKHAKDFNKALRTPEQVVRVGRVFDALTPDTKEVNVERFDRFRVRKELIATLRKVKGKPTDEQRNKVLALIANDRYLVSLILSNRKDLREAFLQLLPGSSDLTFYPMINFIVSHRELAEGFKTELKHITEGTQSPTPKLGPFLRECLANGDKLRYTIRNNPTYFKETNLYIKLLKVNTKSAQEIAPAIHSRSWRFINFLKFFIPNSILTYFNAEPHIRGNERIAFETINIPPAPVVMPIRGTFADRRLAQRPQSESELQNSLLVDLQKVQRVVAEQYPHNLTLQNSMLVAVQAAESHDPTDPSLKNSLLEVIQTVSTTHDATLENSMVAQPQQPNATLENSMVAQPPQPNATLINSLLYVAVQAAGQHYADNQELQNSMIAEAVGAVKGNQLVDELLQNSMLELVQARQKQTPAKRPAPTDKIPYSPLLSPATTRKHLAKTFFDTPIGTTYSPSASSSDDESKKHEQNKQPVSRTLFDEPEGVENRM